MRTVRRALLVAAGAYAVRTALAGARTAYATASVRSPELRWSRTNFRGETVSLAGGPALAVAASLASAAGAPGPGAAAAALTAGLGAGAVGMYDDLVGGRPEHAAKGFHGHLAALRQGRLTSGMSKVIGIGVAGLAAAAMLPATSGRSGSRGASGSRSWSIVTPGEATFDQDRRGVGRRSAARSVVGRSVVSRSVAGRVAETLLAAGVIAGAANLANLLDLRPGRALKVGLLAGAPMLGGPAGGLAAGPVGAAAGLLPEDLAERSMLGDSGANALGALLGTALAARTGPAGRAVALAVIAGLTATSEKVSFTRVIARTPVLRELDQLGRRVSPTEAAAGPAVGPAAGPAGGSGTSEAGDATRPPRG